MLFTAANPNKTRLSEVSSWITLYFIVELLLKINLQLQKHRIYTIRNIHNYSTEEFKTRLSYEFWDSIFSCNANIDTDTLFNLFHITI